MYFPFPVHSAYGVTYSQYVSRKQNIPLTVCLSHKVFTPQELLVYPKYIKRDNRTFQYFIYTWNQRWHFTVFILGLKVTLSVAEILGYFAKTSMTRRLEHQSKKLWLPTVHRLSMRTQHARKWMMTRCCSGWYIHTDTYHTVKYILNKYISICFNKQTICTWAFV